MICDTSLKLEWRDGSLGVSPCFVDKITGIDDYCWEQTTSILKTTKPHFFFSYEKSVTVIIKLADMYVCIKILM